MAFIGWSKNYGLQVGQKEKREIGIVTNLVAVFFHAFVQDGQSVLIAVNGQKGTGTRFFGITNRDCGYVGAFI